MESKEETFNGGSRFDNFCLWPLINHSCEILCKRWLADETGVFKSMCNNRF